jgi:hypothetical protein
MADSMSESFSAGEELVPKPSEASALPLVWSAKFDPDQCGTNNGAVAAAIADKCSV